MDSSFRVQSEWVEAQKNKVHNIVQADKAVDKGLSKWHCPQPSTIKVNVDASMVQNSQTFNVGMVMRDFQGMFLMGINVCLPMVDSVFEAETVGVRETLSWINNQQILDVKVLVETDSLLKVQAIKEAETPTKPTKTEETKNTQIHSRYETIRVPILRPSEYPIWKVKMAIFLEATYPEYLDRINEGPYKPTKLSVAVADQPAKSIPKEKGDYTAEDISSIAKDARVRHLLHSAIDNIMSNRVINCKTAKEIWDALETRCQGTEAIKKNRRTILTQEYEHFDSKAGESLTELYDRFIKLLNDLSLVDKEYDLEDSNLKFLLAFPENWDLKSTTIRDNYALDETTLDEIYGMLKTYELEMDQRSKRHGRKSRIVALKAEEESPKVAISKKGK
ncbi:hypothetical protein AgCh_005433 [Apium graveolens]